MKPILVLLLIMALTAACSSPDQQAARTVCDKVSVCCKSISNVRNKVSNCKAIITDDMVVNEVEALSLMDEAGKILTW